MRGAALPPGAAAAAPPSPRRAAPRAPRRAAPRAAAGDAPPAGGGAPPAGVEFDPEGLLPPRPRGGHFARRREGGAGVALDPAQLAAEAAAAAAAAAAPPPPPPPLRAGAALLAKRAPARPAFAAGPAAPAAPPPPALATSNENTGFSPAAATSSGGLLGAAVEAAFLEVFAGAAAAPRVLASFRRLRAGQPFERDHPGRGLQRADSYVEGLTATPFPDPASGAYPWIPALEVAAPAIHAEFLAVSADAEGLKRRGNNVWVPAARAEALAYGPDWRTLVLQVSAVLGGGWWVLGGGCSCVGCLRAVMCRV
jgi:hypothetical protein